MTSFQHYRNFDFLFRLKRTYIVPCPLLRLRLTIFIVKNKYQSLVNIMYTYIPTMDQIISILHMKHSLEANNANCILTVKYTRAEEGEGERDKQKISKHKYSDEMEKEQQQITKVSHSFIMSICPTANKNKNLSSKEIQSCNFGTSSELKCSSYFTKILT